ncbi:MAG: hypothetical protein ACPG49_01265, partial [Chitinophagales bacterium]
FLIWEDVIWHLNDYLFAPYGDGMKNYYAPAYYIKYGGRLTFNGMGYPYNSYLMYADPMPILAIPLHWINESLFSIEGYTIGIVNVTMIFSVIPCILFLFLIMRHYHLPVWYAMIAALLIAHLSPQFHRFLGHFALSMLTFVPAVWYILIRQTSSNRPYLWGFLQITVLLFFTFIHAYYLLIGVVFILAYLLVYVLQYYSKKQVDWRQVGVLVVTAIAPIIIFKIFQILTDPTVDMHTSPYGFFAYYAEPRTILFSKELPLVEFWKLFYSNHSPKFEGYAYIGFAAVLVVLFTLIKGFKYGIKRQWAKIIRPVLPTNLSTAIWASVVVLLYSMCIPFEQGFAFILDYVPQIKQFRALGRFAWIFYYIFTVYTAFYLYLIFKRMSIKGVKSIAVMMLFLLFSLWAMEGYQMIKAKKDYIVEVNHVDHDFYGKTTDYKNVLAEKGYHVHDFQAIMVFPYFNVGSEKIYVTERGSGGLYLGCKVSYHTGLSMNSTFLGRYSINRAMKMGQLMSNPLIEKEILKDYPNNKPLLLVAHGKNFLPDEQRILEKAKLIYQQGEEAFYELSLSAFNNKKEEVMLQFSAQKDSLFRFQTLDYWSTDSVDNVVINHFEDGNYADALFGKKALQQETGEMVLFEGKISNAKAGQTYIISVWVKSDNKHAAFPDFSYKQFNVENAEIAQIYYDPKDRLDIYKDWVRADHLITIHHPDNLIKVSLVGDNIIADELLIKPLNSDVYSQLKASKDFLFNGYIID